MDFTPEQIDSYSNAAIKFVILIVALIIIYRCRYPIGSFLKQLVKISLKAVGFEASAEFQKPPTEQDQEIIKEASKEQEIEPDEEEESVPAQEDKEPATKEEWEFEMFRNALMRQPDKANDAYKKAFDLSESEKDKNLLTVEYAEYGIRFLGEEKAFKTLEKFTNSDTYEKEVVEKAFSALAEARLFLKDYEKAKGFFEKAKEFSDLDEDICRYECKIALSLFEVDDKDAAFSLLEDMLTRYSKSSLQSNIYEQLADLHERENNHELRALAIEKAIELGNEENQKYFNAGYAYSNSGFDKLSLLHYLKALKLGSGTGVLNNLGVQYEQLGMPIRSISKYRDAFEKSETLSAANMAYRLIDAGFIDEAKSILKNAQAKEEVHQNVNSAIASINQKIEEENKKETEVIKTANKQRLYFRQYAKHYFTKSAIPEIRVNHYLDKKEKIDISIVDGTITGIWKQKGFSSDTKLVYKFEGELHNRAAIVTFYDEDLLWSHFTKETKYQKDTDGYLYIESGESIKLLRRNKYRKHDFEEMSLGAIDEDMAQDS